MLIMFTWDGWGGWLVPRCFETDSFPINIIAVMRSDWGHAATTRTFQLLSQQVQMASNIETLEHGHK